MSDEQLHILLKEAYEAIVKRHLINRDEDGLIVCHHCWRPPEIHKKKCIVLRAKEYLS